MIESDSTDVKAHVASELAGIKKNMDWVKKVIAVVSILVVIAAVKFIFGL